MFGDALFSKKKKKAGCVEGVVRTVVDMLAQLCGFLRLSPVA